MTPPTLVAELPAVTAGPAAVMLNTTKGSRLRAIAADVSSLVRPRIAVMVLVFTQVMNLLLVPYFAHAALTLSIALGALVNALSLLIGLRRQGQYQPLPGWGRLLLQVLLATGVLGAGLYGLAQHVDWVGMRSEPWQRIGLMALVLAGSFVVYFTTLRVIGVDLRALLRRSGHD